VGLTLSELVFLLHEHKTCFREHGPSAFMQISCTLGNHNQKWMQTNKNAYVPYTNFQLLAGYNLQPANSYKCTQLTPKTASVVPPEDVRLAPETCRGLRHNKVIVKVY
jgi:hypothetical protein